MYVSVSYLNQILLNILNKAGLQAWARIIQRWAEPGPEVVSTLGK